jgi:hypothetical protein
VDPVVDAAPFSLAAWSLSFGGREILRRGWSSLEQRRRQMEILTAVAAPKAVQGKREAAAAAASGMFAPARARYSNAVFNCMW